MNPPPAEGLASRLLLAPALRTQPDRRLVTLVRDGYDAAFEEIVRRYGSALRRYAAAIVGGRSEDVTQDAFSKALLAIRRQDAEIELRPWLYRIVRNTALNDLRDMPPDTAELVEGLGGGARSAAEEAERREEVAELVERLRALPETQRAAIVMRELEGLGHGEIAAALGMSGGAARQAIFRARRALRDGLGLMIPLPALRMLFDQWAEAGTAAGASGAAAAVGGAGAATALKVGVLTAVIAGSVGTGLAIKDDRPSDGVPDRAAAAPATDRGYGAAGEGRRPEAASEGEKGPAGRRDGGRGRGGSGSAEGTVRVGNERSRRGDESREQGGTAAGGSGSGPGSGGHSGRGDATGVDGGRSGGSSGTSGGDGSSGTSGSGDDRSGPGGGGGSSGPGSGGSTDGGSSGSGGGDLSDDGATVVSPTPEATTEIDSSGPDGGSGTSGSGSGSDDGIDGGGGQSGPG